MEKAKMEVERHLNLGAVRGEIFDINGEKLAASLAVPSVYADASVINNPGELAEQLAEILDIDQDALFEKLDTTRKFVWIKRRITAHEAEKISQLNVYGLNLSREYRRTYPNGQLAANFLGFVGVDGNGLEGLEKALDGQLKAGTEKIKAKRDNLGRIMVESSQDELIQNQGATVVLTLDRRIQYITEKALVRAAQTHGAKSGMALVVEPKTGAILAAAVWPTFDPNSYNSYPIEDRRNRIVTDPFEPGSTFKVFVAAAALEEKIINPETIINCEDGAFRVANHTVRDTAAYGDLTVSQIIKHSSNIGSLKIGDLLGNDLLYNYLTRFSFGEKTALNYLPAEDAGKLRQPRQWHKVDAANIAFGQGLSTTAMQMVMAMSS
ncbi:MAG: peptidoglycan D,D-transpeptidase FtsI family protein, partial [Candidatus Adiutrix sp.]